MIDILCIALGFALFAGFIKLCDIGMQAHFEAIREIDERKD